MPPAPAAETPEHADLVFELARLYLWWKPIGDRPHAFARAAAQIMNLATYDDIQRLERLVDAPKLIGVMAQAQAGWFSERSWSFWRGRLSAAPGLAETPPRRVFADAANAFAGFARVEETA